jgi:hypothetical protein
MHCWPKSKQTKSQWKFAPRNPAHSSSALPTRATLFVSAPISIKFVPVLRLLLLRRPRRLSLPSLLLPPSLRLLHR